jgi:hypothetical protein
MSELTTSKTGWTGLALATLALLIPLTLPAEAAAAKAPSAVITSVAVKRTAPSDGFAGSVDVRLRLCESVGPGATILVRETRKIGTLTKASERWSDPTGVDLTRIYPYGCVSNYQVSWALKSRFVGPGTYTITIRIRDGYGRLSRPASFSLQPGLPPA